MNKLNVKISAFANYFSQEAPEPVNLLTWLKSDKYKEVVQQIRATDDKEQRKALKAKLPCITPSGTFRPKREEGCLVEHSGLIQFDIDFQDNKHIQNYTELKAQISQLPEVAYCGLSVSGKGYWGLIPIAYPTRHKAQFEALAEDFFQLGIVLDKAPANVASLRGYSWDNEAYFNPEAIPYTKVKQRVQDFYQPTFQQNETDNGKKVQLCIQAVESNNIDITGTYSDWFALGCSLANEFGEAGRDYFHRVSCFYPKYSVRETDKQYDNCKRKGYRFTISTFFHIAQQYGITYSEALKKEWVMKRESIQKQAGSQQPGEEPLQRKETPFVKPKIKPQEESSQPEVQTIPQQEERPASRQETNQEGSLPFDYKIVEINGIERLEVNGLPFAWLNEEEQLQASKAILGKKYLHDPYVVELANRLGLEVKKI